MKARIVALLAALLIAVPVAAQDQAGTIEGIVKDSSGAVLPGVTVEAKAATGTRSTVSDESGAYRFPALPPGRYEIVATLQGFTPKTISARPFRVVTPSPGASICGGSARSLSPLTVTNVSPSAKAR